MVAAALVTIGVVAAARQPALALPQPMLLAWLAVAAVAAIAAAFGPDPLLSALGDSERLAGLVSLPVIFGAFVLGAATGRDGIKTLRTATIVGLVVVVAIALLQLGHVLSRSADRIDGTFGNAGFLGAYLCLVLPIALSALAGQQRRLQLALGALVAAALVVTIATGTRGAWIGVAAGIAVFAALVVKRPRIVAAAVIAVIAIAIVAPVNRDTTRGRLDTWANTVPVLTARPLLGWGPENFRTAFEHTVTQDWVRRYGLEQLPDRAHNRFLDVAATGGLLGLAADIALLALVAAACRRALNATRDDRARWFAVAGISAGLAGWIVQGLFLFDTFDLSILWWLFAGTIVAVAPPTPATARNSARWLLAAALVAVTAFAGVGVAADRTARTALRKPDPLQVVRGLADAAHQRPRQLDVYLLAGTVAIRTDSADALSRAHRLLAGWDDPDVALSDAEVLARLGALTRDPAIDTQAAERYQSVVLRQPNNGLAWLGLGETLIRRGDGRGAEAALQAAATLLPRSPFPSLDLGSLALAKGDLATACTLANRAAALAPKSGQPRDLRQRVIQAGYPCPVN